MSAQVRLRFALQHLQPSDWQAFEQLASGFASVDFPDLRTLAGVGDEGRDAVLFAVPMPPVVLQYSIAEDWSSKIRGTIARVAEAGHPCTTLIYFTNRKIGVAADALKSELLKTGIALDIRDRSYFVERVHHSRGQTQAADDFADRIVNPLLPTEDLVRHSPVTDPHLRAGLLYLELQARDLTGGRNIVRLSYDALALAALKDTDPQTRMTREEVGIVVRSVLPGRAKQELDAGIDGALERLRQKRRINYTGKDQTYNLHFEERRRRDGQALDLLVEREESRTQLIELTRSTSHELEIPIEESKLDAFIDLLESLFEAILERQGNQFAEAVRLQAGGSLTQDVRAAAEDLVASKAGTVGVFRVGRDALVDLLVEAMAGTLLLGGAVRTQLRQLADAYTLLAFMREAPDVQRAVGEFFSRGTLIFDTTALLPCFGETLLDDDEQTYTNLVRGAFEGGMELYVTAGVCNEIYSHFMRAITCSRMGDAWEGPIPLVYADWLRLGATGSFASFGERFIGEGEEDVQLFLETALGFRLIDLEPATSKISSELRFEVQEIWRPRKRIKPGSSEMERDILLRHDLEMYFGVLGERKGEERQLYGYEAWWVTEDRTAIGMFRGARNARIELPSDPCMSPTFLSAVLAIGPGRASVPSALRTQLPLALAMQRHGYGVQDLSALANQIRAEFAREPEWFIRRKVRERMNQLKRAAASVPGAGDESSTGADYDLLTETTDTTNRSQIPEAHSTK
jgi:hypothetical protein